MSIYTGDGKSHLMKKAYLGIDGTARQIKKVYVGVGGKARLVYTSYTPVTGIELTWGDIIKSKETIDDGDSGAHDEYTSSVRIYAKVTPSDATNPAITWTSEKLSSGTAYDHSMPLSGNVSGSNNNTYICTGYGNSEKTYTSATLKVTATTADGVSASVLVYGDSDYISSVSKA